MQLAADFERLRGERGLSLNAVSKYAQVDRNTLSRLRDAGILPRLEILERLARYLGADLNQWRSWAGHAPVPDPSWDPDSAFMAGLRALREELGQELMVSAVPSPDATPEQIEQALADLREAVTAKKKGYSPSSLLVERGAS